MLVTALIMHAVMMITDSDRNNMNASKLAGSLSALRFSQTSTHHGKCLRAQWPIFTKSMSVTIISLSSLEHLLRGRRKKVVHKDV